MALLLHNILGMFCISSFKIYWDIVTDSVVFLLCNTVSQPYVHKYPLLLDFPPPHRPIPSPRSQSTKLSFPCASQQLPLAVCFTHGSVYMATPVSQYTPLPLPLLRSACPFSASALLFLPYKEVDLYYFPMFLSIKVTSSPCSKEATFPFMQLTYKRKKSTLRTRFLLSLCDFLVRVHQIFVHCQILRNHLT